MSLLRVLARGRLAAERTMTDTCVIEEPGAPTTGTDATVTVNYTTVYAGKCRLQQHDGVATIAESGEANLLMVRRILMLPVAASEGVRMGHRVTMTDCVADPDALGRTFYVRDEQAKSHATARRLGIEEATG